MNPNSDLVLVSQMTLIITKYDGQPVNSFRHNHKDNVLGSLRTLGVSSCVFTDDHLLFTIPFDYKVKLLRPDLLYFAREIAERLEHVGGFFNSYEIPLISFTLVPPNQIGITKEMFFSSTDIMFGDKW